MGFKITVQPSQRTFWADDGEILLDAALRQGLPLPHGCRSGDCGACRGKVLAGRIESLDVASPALSEADSDAGYALLCRSTACSELVLESRLTDARPGIAVKTLPARVERMIRAAPDVMILELRLPAGECLPFTPGQYVDILLKDGRRRAFSLASAPRADATLQLHIRRVPGGHFTEHVFEAMKERDIVRLNGPHGGFFLREKSHKPALLIAGGTGFAPLKAIVEHAIATGNPRSLAIYWGGRHRADLYLSDTAQAWCREHAELRFIPVLSAADEADGWDGRAGLVHEAAMADYPDMSACQAYVCGSPAMVAAARHDLTRRCGLPEGEFFADSFAFAHDVSRNT